MPVSDINEQNLKMRDGEKTEADVARHADEWVAAHKEAVGLLDRAGEGSRQVAIIGGTAEGLAGPSPCTVSHETRDAAGTNAARQWTGASTAAEPGTALIRGAPRPCGNCPLLDPHLHVAPGGVLDGRQGAGARLARWHVSPPLCSLTQASQSGHHEPSWEVAASSHASGVAASSPVKWPYLFAEGGFTTPAMCPDIASTKRIGPR